MCGVQVHSMILDFVLATYKTSLVQVTHTLNVSRVYSRF